VLQELNDMTTKQFSRGADKEARRRLEQVIEKVKARGG